MLRVGVMQFRIRAGDRAGNQQKVRAWVAQHCGSPSPTVVVLPEIWDVGYVLDEAEIKADPEGGLAAEFLAALAREYNVWFVGGSVLASTKAGFTNRAQVINPNGELVASYDKVHRIPLLNEDRYLVGGNTDCLFDIEGSPAGCVICYDIRFCEWIRSYALQGAKVLFVSAEWPTVRIDHWRILLQARAVENMMYVVAANCWGESNGTEFGGHSLIFDPWGRTLLDCGEGEGGGVVEIDPASVDAVRDHLKVFSVRVPELYSRVCTKG